MKSSVLVNTNSTQAFFKIENIIRTFTFKAAYRRTFCEYKTEWSKKIPNIYIKLSVWVPSLLELLEIVIDYFTRSITRNPLTENWIGLSQYGVIWQDRTWQIMTWPGRAWWWKFGDMTLYQRVTPFVLKSSLLQELYNSTPGRRYLPLWKVNSVSAKGNITPLLLSSLFLSTNLET